MHNLITGLRGAADMTHDGRITLNEVYQFAYNGTLTQTEKTMNGPQHPHVEVQMTGTGDVVLTEISHSSTVLVLTRDISGKIFIHDDKNILVVEMTKAAGRNIELGLSHFKIVAKESAVSRGRIGMRIPINSKIFWNFCIKVR